MYTIFNQSNFLLSLFKIKRVRVNYFEAYEISYHLYLKLIAKRIKVTYEIQKIVILNLNFI